MTRSQRLLAILEFMRGRSQPVTAAQLAEHFRISERSVYRDIAALNHQGARIDGSAGIGYMLRDGFFLPPLSFTAEEAAAILLGLRFVLRRGDDSLAQAAQAARAKMAASLPRLFGLPGASAVPLLVAPPDPGARPDVLPALRDAMSAERVVMLSYRDGNGRDTQRRVWPVTIGWFDKVETLAAWCEMRSAFRHFRLDRIGELAILDHPFPRPHCVLWSEFLRSEPGLQL